MKTIYRIGQLLNVFLIGVLVGLTLYSTIRHAEAFEAERAARAVTRPRPAPRPLLRGIDSQLACGWAMPAKARDLGWK